MGRRERSYLCLLFGVAVFRLWISPLRSSLWLDETITYWVIKEGLPNIFPRALLVMDSPLYCAAVWVGIAIGGPSEFVMRLPSTIAMGFATFLLYRLGALLFDRSTGLLAALVFACLPGIAFAAADARPYAFAMLAFIAATLMLVRWLDTGHVRDAIGYILLAVLTVYLNYLFATTLAIHVVYAGQHLRANGRVRLGNMIVAALLIAFMLLPLIPYLSSLYEDRFVHSWAPMPRVPDLLRTFAPALGVTLLGLMLAGLAIPELKLCPPAMSHATLVLLASWTTLPPLLLFAASRLTAGSVFVPRYFVSMMAGIALLTGWGIRAIEPAKARLIVATLFVFACLFQEGGVRYIWTSHLDEDWRGAMEAANSISGRSEMPVLFQSGFVEADSSLWFADPRRRDALLAPLSIYPIAGKIIPMPFSFREFRNYSEDIASTILERGDPFLFVGRDQNGRLVEAWLQGRFGRDGFSSRPIGSFGRVLVFYFERERPLAKRPRERNR
jgi:4-amino-4-deoxy-L-arabinose transferase-like glycosyltransferase